MEVLLGYPLDGVVLTIGCDKTTPACLMAAATVNVPAIALSVGPMLNGWHKGQRTGSGTIVWKARELLAAGEIDDDLGRGTCDALIERDELERRRQELAAAGGYKYPPSQTPWQAIQRGITGQLESGAILEGAEQFQRVAQTYGVPRHSH